MKKKLEFTKLIVGSILCTFFIAFIVATCIVLKDNNQLGVYLGFEGTAATLSIGFYVWKAKAENVIKYKQSGFNIPMNTDDYIPTNYTENITSAVGEIVIPDGEGLGSSEL